MFDREAVDLDRNVLTGFVAPRRGRSVPHHGALPEASGLARREDNDKLSALRLAESIHAKLPMKPARSNLTETLGMSAIRGLFNPRAPHACVGWKKAAAG